MLEFPEKLKNITPTTIAAMKRRTSDIVEENDIMRDIILTLRKEISELKKTSDEQNKILLNPQQIREKLNPIILSEVGFFYCNAKLASPQGIMLSLGNLLTSLKSATKITGEFGHYKKVFQECENNIDQAMQAYLGSRFALEMKLCRDCMSELSSIVHRGYGSYDVGMFEMITEKSTPTTESTE